MARHPSTETHRDAARRILELPRCSLIVLNGERRGQDQVIASDAFRIGKSPENDLVLDDATVSRFHCEIVREGRGYLLRDLGSTNGTLLDGAEIREVYLKPGAVITIGKVDLKVQPFSERIQILPSKADHFGEVVGRSLKMREVFGVLERIAPSDATVLICGETGTGKDVVARSIHAASPRSDRPFFVVDCGAVTGSLIESELFGHEKGAFTGATVARAGAFELAHGGTLFLDEIGELPLDLQPKLLRALEQRTVRRVGASRPIRVDIRVVAATNRDLRREVERGKFREDLYFRLAVVPVQLPPLRERRDDIPGLVEHLLKRISGSEPPVRVDEEAMAVLAGHDWPGNVRELRNVLERATYMAQASGDDEIGPGNVPFLTGGPTGSEGMPAFKPGKSYRETKTNWDDLFEQRYVAWLLDRHNSNISAAARAADMDRKYLHKLAKKHGLHPSNQKE